MNVTPIENLILDEANDRTYLVIANRKLSDGEIYRAIRIELMKRTQPLPKGGKLTINIKP